MPGNTVELPERSENSVKGDFGHVLVVGGSRRYTNTPAIVGTAALRTGVDLVTVAAPERSADITASYALNTVTTPLPGDAFRSQHVDRVLDTTAADCLAVGPGLGRHQPVQEAVVELLERWDGPAVVDADAIHAAADTPAVLADTVVTPHTGEFESLTGETVSPDTAERRTAVEQTASAYSCTVLLKGAVDVISDGERTTAVEAGNPYMTRGGTGDTLTGITAGLIAQGRGGFDAAVDAAAVNGAAGDSALKELLAHVSTVIRG
ncbi:MAG: NAD(P)H-hydrate dehydratase [Candidatus Nanohaloarchaea archaeon]|nr:NAD(P)H-hydrate dehydratase [Candidatus Nanohaloarchaea archaeon]